MNRLVNKHAINSLKQGAFITNGVVSTLVQDSRGHDIKLNRYSLKLQERLLSPHPCRVGHPVYPSRDNWDKASRVGI